MVVLLAHISIGILFCLFSSKLP